MSVKSKLSDFLNFCLSKLDEKDKELHRLKSDVNNLVEQAHKEIAYETQQIENSRSQLSRERERFEKYKIKTKNEIESQRDRTEQSIDSYKRRTEAEIDSHIDKVIDYFEQLESYGKDPKLIDAYIQACFILDGQLAKYFRNKPRPNPRADATIRCYQKENKKNRQRILELEYQLSELWAKETDTSENEDFEILDNDEERIKAFISSSDCVLTESERNQKALDNYMQRKHSKAHIGKMYERYIGYLYERDGYDVQYRGIELGLKDGGIDLVCRKRGETILVQCKNWRMESTIYEKHICQLYGASRYYDKLHSGIVNKGGVLVNVEWKATPVFVTTTNLDDKAIEVARALGVKVENIQFDRTYPIIKCNINSAGEKIYHLPMDQMYDETKISKSGETWVKTVDEAEKKGFRRAMRHRI